MCHVLSVKFVIKFLLGLFVISYHYFVIIVLYFFWFIVADRMSTDLAERLITALTLVLKIIVTSFSRGVHCEPSCYATVVSKSIRIQCL